jgi:hypothetical protein
MEGDLVTSEDSGVLISEVDVRSIRLEVEWGFLRHRSGQPCLLSAPKTGQQLLNANTC